MFTKRTQKVPTSATTFSNQAIQGAGFDLFAIFTNKNDHQISTNPSFKTVEMAPIAKKSGKAQKQTKKFIINASQPAADKIFDVAAFEKFLQERIKVEGRTNNLGDDVVIQQQGEGKIEVIAHNDLSGRYLKYLTKKFLKKQQLRDWLRVVSTSRGVYELKFFNVVNDEADEDDE